MTLETCWEGLERAGFTTEMLHGSQTGVFVGVSSIPALHSSAKLEDLEGYVVTGCAGSTLSGRLSHLLGLEGPALTIDTACSSSLVATHLACNALRQGECDMAVSAGVSLMQTPGLHVEFCRLRGVAPDGRCRAFAADTQGTGWGEGSAAVVLKRLPDALRDGDEIHGVLRGTAVNHNGRSAGLTTPSGPAQQRLINMALAAAGLQPRDIDYIEAHGTGTRLGDPIEGVALAEVFGGSHLRKEEPLWVGSAKSNVGHIQAAAGLVGMLKVVLSLRHGMLPTSLHTANPTPAVDWKGAHMALVQQRRPWRRRDGRPRRAGVSAFGIGGTNAHAVLEEPPVRPRAEHSVHSAPLPRVMPLMLSAHSDAALCQQAAKLHLHLSRSRSSSDTLGDVAYSLATTRNHFRHRMVLTAADKTELLDKLASIGGSATPSCSTAGHVREPRLAMLFGGQGIQLSCMGMGLARHFPIFRKTLDEIAALFEGELDTPLLEVLAAGVDSEAGALLLRTDYAQPALFALQVALWRLWCSWGVRPELVLGHSAGELAAAHVAGVIDLPDACRLVAARGRLMQALPSGDGAMVSLEASAVEVAAAVATLGLAGQADVAALNTPMQTVASGDAAAVELLTAHFAAQGRKSSKLHVSRAFHSHHVDDMLVSFEGVVKFMRFHPPTTPIVSGLTGRLAAPGELQQASYWVRQARRPVRFSDAISTLVSRGVDVFLELSPRPVLCGLGVACVVGDDRMTTAAWLPSLVPRKDDAVAIQESLAELHSRGLAVDWAAYFAPFGCRRVELPTYAFQRTYFRDPRGNGKESVGTSQKMLTSARDEAEHSVDPFMFEINWQPVETHNCRVDGSWGLLCPVGEVSWAEDVASALSSAGMRLKRVSKLDDAVGLDGLLCLWDSSADVLRQTRDFTATALAQIQHTSQASLATPLVWITRQAVGTGTDENVVGLGAAPLWGLMRTARNEYPDLCLRLVDVGEGLASLEVLALSLMLEAEPECAVRDGQVLVPRMQRIEQQPAATSLLRPNGAVLITGAFGGIGKHVARWLVGTHGSRDVMLASRRGIDAPGAEALSAELTRLGAEVTVVYGDAADADSIGAIMALFGDRRPLRGVIHIAGVLDDGVISGLTLPRCDTVFRPKVDGAWHLHQATRSMDLDLFVMFSSVSGVMGTAGQANYAAANTFLDALAHLRRAEQLPSVSIAWGTWDGEGMAANLSESCRARYAQLGLGVLSPEDGLELLERAIRSGRALAVAAAYDVPRLRAYHDDREATPPMLRLLLGSGRERASGPDRAWDLRKALSKSDPAEHAAVMLDLVRAVVARVLGFASPDDVNVDVPLKEIGVDSLTTVLLRNQLVALTSLTLSARLAFDHQNLTMLSKSLLSQIQESLGDSGDSGGSSSESASGSAMSNSTTSTVSASDMATVREGYLDPSLTFDNVSRGTSLSRPESVLVTGATGFVGAFIVHQLLELGITVHCLVRAATVEHAGRRLIATLSEYGLWKPDFSRLLKHVVGDMAQPLFGLPEVVFNQLADDIDAICHSSALVDWMRPLEDYIGPNVISTHEVLRLASRGRPKAVHLVSTVSTLPLHIGLQVSKYEREHGYATSKYMSERLVAAARWRGASASSYRLPFVTASTLTGHFRRDRGDFLHNWMAGSIELGAFPSLEADLAAVLPVDYLCKTIVAVMTLDMARIGRDFDFLNTKAPSLTHFFKMMGAAGGQEVIPFDEWRDRALAHAAAHQTSPLARVAALIDGLTAESAAAMLKASTVGEHVFGGEHYPAPAVDEQSVQKYVDRINTARMDELAST